MSRCGSRCSWTIIILGLLKQFWLKNASTTLYVAGFWKRHRLSVMFNFLTTILQLWHLCTLHRRTGTGTGRRAYLQTTYRETHDLGEEGCVRLRVLNHVWSNEDWFITLMMPLVGCTGPSILLWIIVRSTSSFRFRIIEQGMDSPTVHCPIILYRRIKKNRAHPKQSSETALCHLKYSSCNAKYKSRLLFNVNFAVENSFFEKISRI